MRAAARVARSTQAPAEERSADKIAAEIMKLLKCPQYERVVRRLIDDLCATRTSLTGVLRDNKEQLNDLRRLAVKLKKKIRGLPEHLTAVVFASERFDSLYPRLHGTTAEFNPNPRDYLKQSHARRGRLGLLISELDRICKQCDRELGMHGAVKPFQRHAAIASRNLLESVASLTGRKLSLSHTKASKYHRIAQLFFEAATGQRGASLQSACKSVACNSPAKRVM